MHPRRRFLGMVLLLALLVWPQTVQAGGQRQDPPPGPDRVRWVEETYTLHTWWLVRWQDDVVACELLLEHEAAPGGAEIYDQCGAAVYQAWAETSPCETETQETCGGYYLYRVGSATYTRTVPSPLPPARIWLTLGRCLPNGLGVWCPQAPVLTLVGEEPLDGYQIEEIAGRLDDTPFSCQESVCTLPLPAAEGRHQLTVWGYSSYGDSTEVQEMQIEVLPLQEGWQLSVLSEQRQEWPQPFCAEYWQAFPPPELPLWLQPTPSLDGLHTAEPYAYLAGKLLLSGQVDEISCPGGGVEADWATDCGLRAALPLVLDWQNRFDPVLLQVGEQYQTPPVLLKRLFAYESQMWPGQGAADHAGFGQLTISGADLALMWNPRLFEQFCAEVYNTEVCRQGYWRLNDAERQFLQEAFYARMDAACPSCPGQVDLARAEASIPLFAETLRASCAQTGAVVTNVLRSEPGQVFSYTDLWRLTLVNYHAGAGCLGDALNTLRGQGFPLSWQQVAEALPEGCRSALTYVEAITGAP